MAKRPVEKYDFKAFGEAIKAARTGRKESRKQVSDEMYISPRYLANIENKGQHPSLQIFFELMLRYNISVDQFLSDKPAEKKQEEVKAAQPLVDRFKKALGEKVTDVRVSDRLVESPSCVTAEHGQILTAQMRRMLEAAGQEVPEEKFILEINPQHALVQKAAQTSDDAAFAKWAEFIYEEALLSEQGSLKDPNAFVRRLNELLLA